jgi:hypothetical protein
MTKKNILLILAVLLLGGVSLYLNRGRFKSESIKIGDRSLQSRGPARRGQKATVSPVVFLFNRQLQLTSVKVVPLSDIETNKYPHAIWALTSDSNSIPVKSIIYGSNIRGMRPAVKGAAPEALQPNAKYRLFIEAGSEKAEHDFVPKPPVP